MAEAEVEATQVLLLSTPQFKILELITTAGGPTAG
jgi:hypothetical protein